MKKLFFLMGAGAGFVLGSRAGPEPYRKVQETARSLFHRPEVQDKIEKAKVVVDDVTGAVQERRAAAKGRATAATG